MLYFQGEPFLNKDFFEMIRYAVKSNIYTATSTNGHFLDDKNAKNTVDSGLHRIIISIDGTTQESYEKYRSGGDYEKVIRGLKNIVRWKKERNSATPYVIVQFLVLKTNEHEIDTIRAMARELGADKLELKSAQVYQYENDHTLIPDNSKYARYKKTKEGKWALKKPIKNHCFRMWSGAVLTWDGKVVPCCFDKDARHQFGTLEEETFKEIWTSQSYHLFREQILSDRSQIDICRNCLQ
jgi:radical SAM protein with 4Fe4S-binding SPASM domain